MTQSQRSQEERERENRQREEVMILLQKVKEKERRQMGLAPAHMSKARHILCEKQWKKVRKDGWLSNVDKVPPAEFVELATKYSECPSGKKGGDLGWFLHGKLAGLFQDVAFSTTVGATSAPFKSTNGYHIILS
ncbi:unnamed protein product [Camellia sinensis]